MARAGLTVEKITRAAAELTDDLGLDGLTLSAVARRFGVADPSLYSHVANLAELRSRVSLLTRGELADRLGAAVAGRAGREALTAYAAAYRRYAVEHPGRMAAVEHAPAPAAGDRDGDGDGARIVHATYAVFDAYGLREPDLTDAVRFVRSTLHGFTDLERRAHFHDPAPVDATFDQLVAALDVALSHWPARPGPAPVTVTCHRLAVPLGSIPYELRGAGSLMVLVGGPVTRAGYGGLADVLAADHTVLSYDPRGFGQSVRDDAGDLTPSALADDLAALLDTLGAGPAQLVGCSGGAVVALTLAARRPDLVVGVVAHEPPLVRVLDDEPDLPVHVEAVRTTFRARGATAGQEHLAALVAGDPPPDEGPDDDARTPDGGETDRDVASFLGDLLVPTLTSTVDAEALARIPGLVLAVGADSARELPHRCAVRLAERTGRSPAVFPGGHLAAATDPRAFAAAVRRTVVVGNRP